MTFILFAFALATLITMCFAFNERMTRDQANTSEDIPTSEQVFHTLVEKINLQMTLGLFGAARETCLTALETLASARLSSKTISDQLERDLRQLSVQIHELDYEAEAIPLYTQVRSNLKKSLPRHHQTAWVAKTQLGELKKAATKEHTWLGRNINELVPMLLGDTIYDQCRQVADWSKEMCARPEPCYATRRVTVKR